jgi:hypothetical protein
MGPIPLAAAKHRNRRGRLCQVFTPASRRPSPVPRNPSAFPSRSSTLSDRLWRLSGSGRREMSDAVLTASTCGIEWTNGNSLRRWQWNSTNGSRAHLKLRTLTKLPRVGTRFSTPSRFVVKASASRHYSRSTLPADREGTASAWTNGRSRSSFGVTCEDGPAGPMVLHAKVCGSRSASLRVNCGRCRH